MTAQFSNRCRFKAAAIGVPDFQVAAAVAGFLTPAQAQAIDGKVYFYFASASDGSNQWEDGSGIYVALTQTIRRTTITSSSTGQTTPVDFLNMPVVDVFPSPSPTLEPMSQTDLPGLVSTFLPAQLMDDLPDFLPNCLSGLELSTAGGSSSFSVAVGAAADDTNSSVIQLAAALTKTTGGFVEGTGNGALISGSIANNTKYHVFLMRRTDTPRTDIGISTSITPTLPSPYSLSRRIGTITTDGAAHWVKFIQIRDDLILDAPAQLLNGVYSGALTSLATGQPVGVVTKGLFSLVLNIGASNPGSMTLFSPPSVGTGAVVANTFTNSLEGLTFSAYSDLLGQIKFQFGGADGINVVTMKLLGWTDTRGK